ADYLARVATGVVAHVAGYRRAVVRAARMAWAAQAFLSADRDLCGYRRDRRAALADFLRRGETRQRIGGGDLHRAGAGVPGADRTLDRAPRVRGARTAAGRRGGAR